jgi:hypothetical protein
MVWGRADLLRGFLDIADDLPEAIIAGTRRAANALPGGHCPWIEFTRMGRVNRLSGIQAGISGEYFVAAELTRRGYVASLTLRNTKGIDVLASNADATKSVGIQVKTCQGLKPVWLMNVKHEADQAENLFFVFVCLPQSGAPSFYVVPRQVVANQVSESHRQWLATPGRGGRRHRDNPNRKFGDPNSQFKDRWDLLGLD